MEHTMILALHSLADFFTGIRYSWGQYPRKKHPFFWAAQIEFDTLEKEKRCQIVCRGVVAVQKLICHFWGKNKSEKVVQIACSWEEV